MKVLTVCSEGINRSVVLASITKYKWGDVIAIGVNNTSPETLEMLYNWADYIIVVDKRLITQIPTKYSAKVKDWDVGEDRYPRAYNQELVEIFKRYIEQDKL